MTVREGFDIVGSLTTRTAASPAAGPVARTSPLTVNALPSAVPALAEGDDRRGLRRPADPMSTSAAASTLTGLLA